MSAGGWHRKCNGWLSPNKQRLAGLDTHPDALERKVTSMTKIAANDAAKINDETPVELQEMAAAIDALPARYRDAVAPALARVVECSTRRRRILNLVQEALSQLRLDMKYLIFDLEATRRERDQYKEMLEQDGSL